MMHRNTNTNDCSAARSTSTAVRGSLLLLLQLLLLATPSDATISIIDSGKKFPSKPDPRIGQPLLRGYEYMGRLQYVPDNPTLCPGPYPHQAFDIVTPTDGLPVALVARSGGCSIFDKVRVASNMINPSNTVGYLIVQDASKHHLLLPNDATATTTFESSSQLLEYSDNGMVHIDDEEYESYWEPGWKEEDESYSESPELFELELAEQNGRALIQLLPEQEEPSGIPNPEPVLDDINMAVLHVAFGTGQALFEAIATEHIVDRRQGGSRVLLNGTQHSFGSTTRTVIVWMLITVSCCACACGCLLLCVHTDFDDDADAPQAPRRPVRRRLTLDEVRTRFPSYHFHLGTDAPHCCASASDGTCASGPQQQQQQGYMELSDECTICLDEFTPGVRVRKLPCEHIFHSTCIARWLIERSAVCPLCKLDLYIDPVVEFDESSSDDDDESSQQRRRRQQQQQQQQRSPFWSGWWTSGTESNDTGTTGTEYTTQLAVPSGAALIETNNERGDENEPRSWWPFSLEIVPSTDEEEGDNDEPEPNHHRRSSSPSALSAMAGMISSLSNVFGTRTGGLLRQQQQERLETETLTELTEPLVSQGAVDEPSQAPRTPMAMSVPDPGNNSTGSTGQSDTNTNTNTNTNDTVPENNNNNNNNASAEL